jgi:hypothetical protein
MTLGRQEGARDISVQLKSVIIALKLFYNLPWVDLSSKTGVSDSACLRVWRRASEQAESTSDLNLLLDTLVTPEDTPKRTGRHPIIPPGSSDASAIRESILYHEDLPLHEAGSLANIPIHSNRTLARSTYEKIAHKRQYKEMDSEHPFRIIRGVRPFKPALSKDNKTKRIEYSRWLESKILLASRKLHSKPVIFICSDEKWVNFRGGDRHKQRVSQPKGAPSTKYAQAERKPRFTIKIWYAACLDNCVERPISV